MQKAFMYKAWNEAKTGSFADPETFESLKNLSQAACDEAVTRSLVSGENPEVIEPVFHFFAQRKAHGKSLTHLVGKCEFQILESSAQPLSKENKKWYAGDFDKLLKPLVRYSWKYLPHEKEVATIEEESKHLKGWKAKWHFKSHACPWEALASILFEGKVRGSDDASKGHRFNNNEPALYTGHDHCGVLQYSPFLLLATKAFVAVDLSLALKAEDSINQKGIDAQNVTAQCPFKPNAKHYIRCINVYVANWNNAPEYNYRKLSWNPEWEVDFRSGERSSTPVAKRAIDANEDTLFDPSIKVARKRALENLMRLHPERRPDSQGSESPVETVPKSLKDSSHPDTQKNSKDPISGSVKEDKQRSQSSWENPEDTQVDTMVQVKNESVQPKNPMDDPVVREDLKAIIQTLFELQRMADRILAEDSVKTLPQRWNPIVETLWHSGEHAVLKRCNEHWNELVGRCLRYGPKEWYDHKQKLRQTLSGGGGLWVTLCNACNVHGNTVLRREIAEYSTEGFHKIGSFSSIEFKYNPETKEYTNLLKFRVQGTKATARYSKSAIGGPDATKYERAAEASRQSMPDTNRPGTRPRLR